MFADVPTGDWAETYIYSTRILGWLQGGADELFHPEREITRTEAVTAINRMLGRDESVTELLSVKNPFSDLAESHWAYANVLEAAGVLKDNGSVPEAMSAARPLRSRLARVAHHCIQALRANRRAWNGSASTPTPTWSRPISLRHAVPPTPRAPH